jgi:predicted nucleotidyltransferase
VHPLIQEKREAIEAVCREFGVRRLEVFGSAARGSDFDIERSDVDFLVEFLPGSQAETSLSAYLALRERLSEVLQRPVDLVTSESVENPYVRAEIEQSREPIHAP